jgi:hypothetical protein
MFFKKSYSPWHLACKVQIQTIPLSKQTKAFLKEKAIKTLFDFLYIEPGHIQIIPDDKVRIEVQNFHERLLTFVEKEEVVLQFSKSIQKPQIRPRFDEKIILEALLTFESFFGSRRNITAVKRAHLPRLYEETENYAVQTTRFLRRYRIAS